jgi:uncharacterized protein YaaW (UPF0174 family)
VTHVDPEHREFTGGTVKRALAQIGGEQLQKRSWVYARKKALKLVLRRLAGPVDWALTAWEWLGPAYRLTVPTVCYVAYLRQKQSQVRATDEDQARAAS